MINNLFISNKGYLMEFIPDIFDSDHYGYQVSIKENFVEYKVEYLEQQIIELIKRLKLTNISNSEIIDILEKYDLKNRDEPWLGLDILEIYFKNEDRPYIGLYNLHNKLPSIINIPILKFDINISYNLNFIKSYIPDNSYNKLGNDLNLYLKDNNISNPNVKSYLSINKKDFKDLNNIFRVNLEKFANKIIKICIINQTLIIDIK